MFAYLHAAPAAGTQVPEKQELGSGGLRFRVAAPQATQGAALEKDGRPQAGAVMNGHPLNIVNDSSYGHGTPWLEKGTGQASPRGSGKNGRMSPSAQEVGADYLYSVRLMISSCTPPSSRVK